MRDVQSKRKSKRAGNASAWMRYKLHSTDTLQKMLASPQVSAADKRAIAKVLAMRKNPKRKNFLGLGKKTTHSSRLLSEAYSAGRSSGDTARFDDWISRQGDDLAGSFKKRLRDRYHAGVHALWSEDKKEAKQAKFVEKKEAVQQSKSVKQEVLARLEKQGMRHTQTAAIVKRAYRKGDTVGDLYGRVLARNPKKFDRCVKDVKKSAKKSGKPANAYAVCTHAGTRNPSESDRYDTRPEALKAAAWWRAQGYQVKVLPVLHGKWRVLIQDQPKAKNTKSKNALMTMRQGDAKATIRRKGFLNWEVQIIKPGYQVIEPPPFSSYEGALAFARLKLHDIATNPNTIDLIPGGSTLDAWGNAGHRIVKGVAGAAKKGLKKAGRLVRSKNGKRNPLELAQQRHEEFTGFPSEETLELTQRQHVHTTLTGLAQFVCFVVIDPDGRLVKFVIAPGMRYTGHTKEILGNYSGPFRDLIPQVTGEPSGDWEWDSKKPAKDIIWLTASEQRERGGKEVQQQLYLSGGNQGLDETGLKYLNVERRDVRDNMLIGTIARVWYWTRKKFEDGGKTKTWFYHDFGKEGSGGMCPVLIYHPLNPSFEIAGGRYYIALPDKSLGNVSPGIVG